MNLLAIDTSTEVAGICYWAGERPCFAYQFFHRMDLSQRLFSVIDWLLRTNGVALSDVGAIGVGLGPGSFTGVRVGVTAAKILAQVNALPLAGVSTLAVLARGLGGATDTLVCPCIDARRQEVYAAVYRVTCGVPKEVLPAEALSADALARQLASLGETVTVCGTGAVRYWEILEQSLGDGLKYVPGHDFPSPVDLALLAQQRLQRGDQDNPLALTPLYARLPEAERNLAGARRGCAT